MPRQQSIYLIRPIIPVKRVPTGLGMMSVQIGGERNDFSVNRRNYV